MFIYAALKRLVVRCLACKRVRRERDNWPREDGHHYVAAVAVEERGGLQDRNHPLQMRLDAISRRVVENRKAWEKEELQIPVVEHFEGLQSAQPNRTDNV